MAKKKQQKKEDEFPKIIETFRRPGQWELRTLTLAEPSCWNGDVAVERYRVTIEKIEEPKEVIAERLRKLWRECDNHHHHYPLRAVAERLDIELELREFGKDRDKKNG